MTVRIRGEAEQGGAACFGGAPPFLVVVTSRRYACGAVPTGLGATGAGASVGCGETIVVIVPFTPFF